MFIVFEGIDASGKGTQVAALHRKIVEKPEEFNISGRGPVVKTKEPTNSEVGKLIKEYLKGTCTINPRSLALLFTSDRFYNLLENVAPTLQNNGIVLLDRYVYSTIAYQGAEKADMEWICRINDGIITPDLVIYLDIDPKESLNRLRDGSSPRAEQPRDVFETKPLMLRDVRDIYLKIVKNRLSFSREHKFLNTNFEFIDSRAGVTDVSNQITECVLKLFSGGYPLHSNDCITFKETF